MKMKFGHTVKALFTGKRGKRGESLTEALASIAIGALALVMLAMAISVSTNIAVTNRDNMKAYYDANAAAIEGSTTSKSGTIALESGSLAIAEKKSDGAIPAYESIDVTYYENLETGIYLYNSGGGS